jgi:hypothetical protein
MNFSFFLKLTKWNDWLNFLTCAPIEITIISNGSALVENERKNSSLFLCCVLLTKALVFTRLHTWPDCYYSSRKTNNRERERERLCVRVGRENLRRTIHSHTFRAATHIHIFIHDKPCAAIEVVYNTNPIVNISLNFFFFLLCSHP